MIYTHRLTLDLNGRQNRQFVEVKQFDENSHRFIINVVQNGETVALSPDLTYKMRIVKADKTWCIYNASLQDGSVVAIPGDQAFTVKGIAFADIEITEGNQILSTECFLLDVGPSGVGEHLASSNEYKELQDLIAEATAIVGGSYGYYIPSITPSGDVHFEKSRPEMLDLEDVHIVTIDQVDDHEVTMRLLLTELTHGKEENAQRDSSFETLQTAVAGHGTRLSTAEGNITSLGARMDTAEGNITTQGGKVTKLEGKMSTAEGNITKLLARTAIEAGTVTLTNNQAFPFNNSQVTVPLVTERANQNYIVDYEVTAATGNVGDIIVSAKLVNGFKIEHTGSASSVTVKYQVLGGMA